MTRCAGVAQHKVHTAMKNQTGDKVTRGTRKTQTNEKRLWKGPECKIAIKDSGNRRQLHWTSDGFDRKAFGLEFVKRATGMSSRLQKMRNWTLCKGRTPLEQKIKDWALWRGQPPPKRKRNLQAVLV
jgi:hypothetical protein